MGFGTRVHSFMCRKWGSSSHSSPRFSHLCEEAQGRGAGTPLPSQPAAATASILWAWFSGLFFSCYGYHGSIIGLVPE